LSGFLKNWHKSKENLAILQVVKQFSVFQSIPMGQENIIRSKDFMHLQLLDSAESQYAEERIIGDSQSSLLLVISEEESLQDSLQTLAANILKAAGIDSLNAVQLLSVTPSDTFSLASVLRNRGIQRCIVFGAKPQALQLHIPLILYRTFLLGGARFVFSDTLSDIQHSKALKKELWQALQQLFNLDA
jgi:DNA polymerase III psi subunit